MGKKAAKKKSAGEKAADRRQSVRFFVAEKTKGRVTSTYEALLMNISRRGTLIEHDDLLNKRRLGSPGVHNRGEIRSKERHRP